MTYRRFWPLGIFLFFWLLYQVSLPFRYSYDGLCYALDVEFGSLIQLLHANHLLYSVLMRGVYRLYQWVGFTGRALFLMQAINAAAGALAVTGMAWLMAKRVGPLWGSLGAALFGVSHAFWTETMDPGCYAFAALAVVGLLYLLDKSSSIKPFWIGFGHGLLALVHQMLVLIVPACVLRVGWAKERRAKRIASYGIGFTLGAVVPYAGVAVRLHGNSWHEALYWALGPAGPRPGTRILSSAWWSLDLGHNLSRMWGGFAEAWAAAQPHFFGVLIFMVILAALLRVFRSRLQKEPLLASLWVWIGILCVFQFFFYTGTLRYRILVFPPLLFAVLIAMDSRARRFAWVAGAFIVLLAGVNHTYAIRPARSIGSDALRTSWVRSQVGPKDFFLFAGQGQESITNVYMAYFGKDVPARSLLGYLFIRTDGRMDALTSHLSAVHAAGGRIFIEAPLLEPGRLQEMEERQNIQFGTLIQWVKTLKPIKEQQGPEGYRLLQVIPVQQKKSI